MACEENTLGFVVLTTTGQFYDGCFWVQGRVTQGDSRLAETGRPIKTHQLNLYRIEYLVGNPLFLIELKQLGPRAYRNREPKIPKIFRPGFLWWWFFNYIE